MIFYRDPATAPALPSTVSAEQKQSNRSLALEFLMVMAAVAMMCSAYLMITSSRSESSTPSRVVYTVASGDTLGKLAKRFYGSDSEWERIYKANESTLKNPDHLEVGSKLKIPPNEQ